MKQICEKKIRELHVFIESWMNGSVDNSEKTYRNFVQALDTDFVIIPPGGVQQTREQIIIGFRAAYASQAGSFRIEIRNVRAIYDGEEICIMNYEEWQVGAQTQSITSTVTFQKCPENGDITWLHLHETLMPVQDS